MGQNDTRRNVQYNVRRRGKGDGAERALSEGRSTASGCCAYGIQCRHAVRTWNGKWDGPECGTWRNGPQQEASVPQHKFVVRTFSVENMEEPELSRGET